MLLPGEFAALGERVQALNGFDRDMNELVDDVKLIKEGDGDANYAYYASMNCTSFLTSSWR